MKTKFKKGIASFYIVTFTTLILTIMTASFAVVMVSETSRTSNDDLSQSAYDAALAGIEDAKLAYANYQRCKTAVAENTSISSVSGYNCGDVINMIENNSSNCDVVGKVAGRLDFSTGSGEVLLQETSTTDPNGENNNMNQAYTCVTIKTTLDDYRSTLSTNQRMRVIRGIFATREAEGINSIKLSWYTNRPDASYVFNNVNGANAVFKNASNLSKPPVLEVQIVQTAENFTMKELLSKTEGNKTDRATMFLVPNNVYGRNSIEAVEVAGTNDQKNKKNPFPIKCTGSYADTSGNAFACSVVIALPYPINYDHNTNKRSDDTFAVMVALPYGEPETDFSLMFCSDDGGANCGFDATTGAVQGGTLSIRNLQVEIDSTGRANDLYRRVVTRLETTDIAFAYPYYALQLLKDSDTKKNMTVLCETGLYNEYNGSTTPLPAGGGTCHKDTTP